MDPLQILHGNIRKNANKNAIPLGVTPPLPIWTIPSYVRPIWISPPLTELPQRRFGRFQTCKFINIYQTSKWHKPKEKHASDIMWILCGYYLRWTTDHGTMELQKWSFGKFGKLMCSRIQASFQWPTVPTIGVAFQYFLISHLTSTSWVSLCMPAIKISSLQTSPVSNNRFMLCFSSYWMQPWTDKQNKIGRFCCF